MAKKLTCIGVVVLLLAAASVCGLSSAEERTGIRPTPPLRVEGNQLKDPAGNTVLLHGWMQPTASYFNGGGKWYFDPWDWTKLRSPLTPSGVMNFLEYLEEVAVLMSDPSPRYGRDHGWHCSFVRLNLDGVGGWSSAHGLTNPAQFDAWIENFLVPYVNILRSRGIYLVLCATGPMIVNVDGDMSKNAGKGTQERLITFWERVASAPGIKNAPNVMFELMNEPVLVESALGSNQWGMQNQVYFEAFTKWLQPIIDTIRATGANNIIWVPTLEWQGSPQQWAMYPFEGENIGVAVHFYPAYGGVFDNTKALQSLWDRQYKPAADRWPMIITEMFWTPMPDDPRNLVNGRTEGFGNAIKKAIDTQGNVSFLVGFIGDLLDDLGANRPYDCELADREGAQAFFDWMPELAALSVRSFGYQQVPGRIEAEDFEQMAPGIKVDSNPEDASMRHLRGFKTGSWLSYLIDVPQADGYLLQFRFQADAGAKPGIVIKNGSGEVLQRICDCVLDSAVSDSGGWLLAAVPIALPQGRQELVVEFQGEEGLASLRLDWWKLSAAQ